ncbi:MAG TPA: hypothetical protein VGR24_00005, partial [bacterium]|nr:hypothetical protein [bacterium]
RDRERKRVKEFMKTQEEEGRVTIGDIAGELLRQVIEPEAAAKPAEAEEEKKEGEVPSGS